MSPRDPKRSSANSLVDIGGGSIEIKGTFSTSSASKRSYRKIISSDRSVPCWLHFSASRIRMGERLLKHL
jgi:hypothetical protein